MCDLPPKMVKRIPIASMRAVRFTCKLGRRTLLPIGRRQSKEVGRLARAGKKKFGRTKRTSMCDLPADLVGEEIFTRVPITSLGSVRSTCKLWNALTKECILGKAVSRQQYLGFMTKDAKVCSVRSNICRSKHKEDVDLLDISVKQVDLLNHVEISQVFHCDGLLLCISKDKSRHVVWNPYLGQTTCIRPNSDFHISDNYALGYDITGNHKILRFFDDRYEIYEISSNSWRVLKITPDWEIESIHGGVSIKGNAYFYAHEGRMNLELNEDGTVDDIEDFLLCFDFTTERFGLRLPLPFHNYNLDTVALSCVREERLAVLYATEGNYFKPCNIVEIWVTTTVEPNQVSWSKFLRVEMQPSPRTGIWFDRYGGGSFFIDEEEKIAVVFDLDFDHNTAFVIGEDGYFKPVRLGVALQVAHPWANGSFALACFTPLVCSSSYFQSLVQLNQSPKGKERAL